MEEKFIILVPKFCIPSISLLIIVSLLTALFYLFKYKKKKRNYQKQYAIVCFIIAIIGLCIIASIVMATILKISFFSFWQFLITGFTFALLIISLIILIRARKQEKADLSR